MISLAQVVAALAAGALLTIAVMLAFRLYGLRREVERIGQQRDENDRELGIETAALLIEHGFDLLQQTADGDEESNHSALPPGAVAAVRKGHLRMLVFGGLAGLLAGAGGWLGKLWRHPRRKLAGQVLTGAAVGTAATLLLVTPWQNNDHNDQAPPPGPTASPTTSTSRLPGNTPGPTVTITPTGSLPPPPAPGPSSATLTDGALGPANPTPSAGLTGIAEGPGPGEPPTASARPSSTQPGDDETTTAPSPEQPEGGSQDEDGSSGLCLDVTVPPLLDAGICLLGGG